MTQYYNGILFVIVIKQRVVIAPSAKSHVLINQTTNVMYGSTGSREVSTLYQQYDNGVHICNALFEYLGKIFIITANYLL